MSKLSASQVRAARRERRDKKKKIFRIATTSVVSMIALIFVISFNLAKVSRPVKPGIFSSKKINSSSNKLIENSSELIILEYKSGEM